MSKRSDIADGSKFNQLGYGLVYTEVLGWIDMGHALGKDIISLKEQFIAGEQGVNPFYEIFYHQSMEVRKFGSRSGIGKFSRWRIKRGRSKSDISSIMLAIMMNTAAVFEELQSSPAFSWYTDSGFSGEDLVSDLFGFYRCMIPGNYSYRLRPVSYEAAVRRWDYYGPIGIYKNRSFRPLLFPDPQDPCARHQPYLGFLPQFMTWVSPWKDFSSGIVEVLTNDGTKINFTGIKK